MKKLLAVLGLVAASAACPLIIDTVDPYGPQGLDASLSNGYCSYLYDCCNASERLSQANNLGSVHSTKAECVEEFSKNIRAAFAAYAEAEADGRIEWDRTVAESCYGPFAEAARECDASAVNGGAGVSCDSDELVVGKVPAGETCYFTYECADEGAICDVDNGDEGEVVVTVRGTCVAPLGAGDSCAGESRPCGPGLYCDDGTDACRGYAGVGESCDDGIPCESETGYCDYDTDTGSYVCMAYAANGETCDSDYQCHYDSYCDGVCRPWDDDPTTETNITYDICTGE